MKLALSVGEAARALGVSKSTVYREIRAGRLPSFQLGGRRLIGVAALERRLHELSGGEGGGVSQVSGVG